MSAFRVIGTAGHIDHGKTSLVKALTGIDTDRLKEEKQRGITIELGFAHLQLPSGTTVSVVDVPGHERFIRTMVAGAVGIDTVILVVAADEGVMPQTREHLDICGLLGIRSGVVALTKCDLVTAELLDLAKQELHEVLAGTFLATSEIVPCSVKTGAGLSELPAAIERALRDLPSRDEEALVRLPVDRVFTLKGFGTVVTGTLWSGRLQIGDELVSVPQRKTQPPAKVRGLHVHGVSVSSAVAGQRIAVNLSVPLTSISRGETLANPDQLAASSVMDVELRYLPVTHSALPRRSRLLVHLGTAQRLANITLLDREQLEPGQTGLAQLTLAEPLCVMPGDRFVLRGFALQKNHGTTLGGGTILRNLATPQRRKSPALVEVLRTTSQSVVTLHDPKQRDRAATTLTRLHIERRTIKGSSLSELQRSLPIGLPALRRAIAAITETGAAIRLADLPETEEGAWLSQVVLQQLNQAIIEAVSAAQRSHPDSPELAKELLRAQLGGPLRGLSVRVFDALCAKLISEGSLIAERERLRLPMAVPTVVTDSPHVMAVLSACVRVGLAAPRIEDLPALLSQQTPIVPAIRTDDLKKIVEQLVRRGDLVRLKDLLFSRKAIAELSDRLVAFLTTQHEISPGQFKDLVAQSRKYSIPLAEYFDAQRLTLRVGDQRRLRGRT